MPDDQKATFINNSNYNPEDYNNADDEMPATGADNGLSLADLRGVAYDDEQWDQLLDQMTVADMDSLIALGGYQTNSVKSIDKVQTMDCDGPASINNNFTGTGSVGFPSVVMIANTWNTDIATAFGESIGKMADEMGVSGWYAPAMNIHRTAFAGRNFEYYSEDGLLSGKMAANAILGAKEYGVYAYMKHFALNDQESNRLSMLCTWSNEQAIRQACKNILYTVVNSRAYDAENLETGLMTWQIAAIVIDVVAGVILIALEAVAIKNYIKRRKA